tara:strand:- start:700 stop:1098 length:399 start_codon:yes stop_codon:yes gene_type:complete
MDNKISIIRYLYYFSLIGLILIYLFPGSLLGFLFYGTIKQQPNLVSNPFGTSINHLLAFFYLSIIGLISYFKDKNLKKIMFFLISISILLELLHLIIPVRTFQTADLVGNLLGTIIAIIIIFLYKRWKYGKV